MTVFTVLHSVKRFVRLFSFYSIQLLLWLILFGGYHHVFVTIIILSECAILILRNLQFKGLCEIVNFSPNKGISVTFFVRGQYCDLIIANITGECAISLLQKIRLGVYHSCYCLLMYYDSIIFFYFILKLPIVQWLNFGWWNGVMEWENSKCYFISKKYRICSFVLFLNTIFIQQINNS